jgi:hypothetical protein
MWVKIPVLAMAAVVPATFSVPVIAKAERGLGAEPFFVALPEVIVPIIDSGRMNGRFRFGVVLNATDEAAAARLTADAPRVQSTLLASGIEFSRLYVSGLTPVDAGALAAELNRLVCEQYPDVSRVLIVNVSAEIA